MRSRDLALPVLAAVLVVAAPAVFGLFADAPLDDDYDEVGNMLGEMQEIADGELARGRRMEPMARDIRRARMHNEGYRFALNAEAR